MKGTIFNLQRFSIHDGPGLRTTVFLKGCPLHCRWCHNPEGLSGDFELMWFQESCVRCGACVKACRYGALEFVEFKQASEKVLPLVQVKSQEISSAVHGFAPDGQDSELVAEKSIRRLLYHKDKCKACQACIDACHYAALKGQAQTIASEDLVAELLKEKIFYDQSGGGVTFSGGEPLVQADFVAEVAQKLKQAKVHVTVDTSGSVAFSQLEKVLPYTDLFLYDLKHTNPTMLKAYTGAQLDQVSHNLNELLILGSKVELRVPLIGGYNFNQEFVQGLIDLKQKYQWPQLVLHLLPYHEHGKHKYDRLEQKYLATDFYTPSNEELLSMKDDLDRYFSVEVNS